MKSRFVSVLIVGVLAAIPAGCSDKEAQDAVAKRKASLKIIGTTFRDFRQQHNRSPEGINELVTFIQEQTSADDAFAEETVRRLSEAEVVVFWKAGLLGDDEENARYVLAYEASVPRTGGYLVTGAGKVMLVTPGSYKEFKEYPPE